MLIVDPLKLIGDSGSQLEISSNTAHVTLAITDSGDIEGIGVTLTPKQAREVAIKLCEIAWWTEKYGTEKNPLDVRV